MGELEAFYIMLRLSSVTNCAFKIWYRWKKILQVGGVGWSGQVEIRLTQLLTELNFSNFNTARFF